jgi:hypothetical protein
VKKFDNQFDEHIVLVSVQIAHFRFVGANVTIYPAIGAVFVETLHGNLMSNKWPQNEIRLCTPLSLPLFCPPAARGSPQH